MMSKMKSKNVAKLKLLLVLPLALLLVLAFASPTPAKRDNSAPVSGLQENAAQSQEDLLKKEKIAQAEETLRMLKEKEADIRTQLEKATDLEIKNELEIALKQVRLKEKELESFLQQGGGAPGSAKENLHDTFKMLQDKEMKIREKLNTTEDPEKKAELQALLTKVLDKEAQVKAMIAEGKNTEDTTIDELKKVYTQLKEKEEDIRVQLDKTEDPQKKAELKAHLEEVLKKEAQVKAKAEAMKKAQGEKKN